MVRATRWQRGGAAIVTLVALLGATVVAAETAEELTDLSIEELLQVEITSVSKVVEPLFRAPAAVYVVSGDDIRRSGATTLAEALRMAPGVDVASFDANRWAISVRGFNDVFANKLLVLIDGRSVYTPLFGGVFWDVQDTLLEDVDRIEIIRGPGGTLWGANAVNGVINITTKSARETQGLLATAGGGSEERGFGGLRYGGRYGEGLFYRVYAKYFDRSSFTNPGPGGADDQWHAFRAGFRADWDLDPEDTLTFQGDIYDGRSGTRQIVSSPTAPYAREDDDAQDVAGGNLIGRWNHVLSPSAQIGLQLYYDRTERDIAILRETRDTFDGELQHDFALGPRIGVIWGLGYRLTADDTRGTFTATLRPASRDDHLFSTFVQAQTTLIEERLRFIAGTKVQYNDYTGWEVQPSGRLLWTPDDWQTAWAAISRAVRTPSRIEDDLRFNLVMPPTDGGPTYVSVFGSSRTKAEELLAYEAGYRVLPHHRVAVDVALFYNDYDTLASADMGVPFGETDPPPPHLVVPLDIGNAGSGETWGVEVAVDWNPFDWWHLAATYSYLDFQLRTGSPTAELFGAGDSPHNKTTFHSLLNVRPDIDIDSAVYYVDSLSNVGVPSYVRLNLRVAWRPLETLELSVVGQNLGEAHHAEFVADPNGASGGFLASEVPRGAYGKVTWRF